MKIARLVLALVAGVTLLFAAYIGWVAFTPVTPANVEARLSRTCAAVMTAYLVIPTHGQATGARPWTVCACIAAELGKDPAAAAPLVEAVRQAMVSDDADNAAFERALKKLGEIGPACARG